MCCRESLFRTRAAAFALSVLVVPPVSGQAGVWNDLQPAVAPSFRATHGLATEPWTGLTVLFGGGDQVTPAFSETWIFDGCSWTFLAANPHPPVAANTCLAPSPVPGRVVLFGGNDGTGAVYSSTWEFDLATGTWTDMTPAGPSPPPRQMHAMALDSARGRVVLFGGADANYAPLGDTWEWDGAAWSDVTPPTGPAARGWHPLAFDSTRGRTVLFGGYNGAQLGDTWEWDGVQWSSVSTAAAPSPRSSVCSAYDPASRRVVLFGGSAGWPTGMNDTWEYDGVNWAPATIFGTTPVPQYLQRMASDPARGGILLFGAYGNNWAPLGETWRYQRAALTASTATPAPGTVVGLGLALGIDAGLPYLAAASLSGSCPGIPVAGGRFVPLNYDAITALSLSGIFPQTFQGFSGSLDASGAATLGLAVPALSALSGAVVTLAAATASGPNIASITNPLRLVIQ